MIQLKVHGGTLPDKRLCDSCRWSQVMKHSDGTERVACFANGNGLEIHHKVVECNDYANRTHKMQYELEKIGWVLDVKGKTILGFKPPNKKDDD